MKRNKVIRLSLNGGIIGLLTTNPRKILDDAIDKANHSNSRYPPELEPHGLVVALIF